MLQKKIMTVHINPDPSRNIIHIIYEPDTTYMECMTLITYLGIRNERVSYGFRKSLMFFPGRRPNKRLRHPCWKN